MVEMEKILYYPTIVIPSEWAKWATLYFDKVSSIIPQNMNLEEITDPYNKKDIEVMNILMEEGELQPSDPMDLLGEKRPEWANVEAFEKEFKKIVTSNRFQSVINRNWKQNPIWRVHNDKISYKIYEFLKDLGLAEKDKNNWDWILMEEKTSLLYISLLAKYLADIDIDYTVPGTDSSEYEHMIYGASSHQNGFVSLDVKFVNILPIPAPDVPINKIIEFKRKRKDELSHFRKVIYDIYREIQDISEAATAKEITEKKIKHVILRHKRRIEKEVIILEKTMKEDMRRIIKGGVLNVLIYIGSELLGNSSLEFKTVILGAAIRVSIYLVDEINKQRAKLRESPFAYLYNAKKNSILKIGNGI